jgi:hypothetical protein
MAAITRYKFCGLSTTGSAVHLPVERGGLRVSANHVLDRLESAHALKPDLILNRGNRVEFLVSTFDPSLFSAWTEYGSGKTYTGIVMHWRAFENNAGMSSTWLSWASAQGIIVPVALAGGQGVKATLALRIIPLWATGTLLTIGSSSGTAPTVAKAYYPTSIVAGSDTVTAIQDLAINWEHEVGFDDQYQPSYCYYDRLRNTGRATLKDLSKATAARLAGNKEATLTTTFTDAGVGGGTLVNTLSNCWTQAVIDGDMARLDFEQVT